MLPKGYAAKFQVNVGKNFADKFQVNVSKSSFWKCQPLGKRWKSKCMRIIPEEFLISTQGAFEHRVVCSVLWGNSWQFWLEREKKGLVIDREDWDEFVDRNLLGLNDILLFEHEDSMFLQLRIFKRDGREIISAPVKPEPEPETEPQNFHQETTTASTSANGVTYDRARQDSSQVKNPERYLLNPKNPYFVRTLTKWNDVLYVPKKVIRNYGLKFAPRNTAMSFLLPDGNLGGYTKHYSGKPCFGGWTELCRKYNLNDGDSVVCELELSRGVVSAVRLHFPKE